MDKTTKETINVEQKPSLNNSSNDIENVNDVYKTLGHCKDETNVYHNPLFIQKNIIDRENKNRKRRQSWGQKHLYHECKKSTTLSMIGILYIIGTVFMITVSIRLESKKNEQLHFYELFVLYGIFIIQVCIFHLYQESRRHKKSKLTRYMFLPNFIVLFIYFITLSNNLSIFM